MTSRCRIGVTWLAGVLLATSVDAGLGLAHAQEKFDAAYAVTLLGVPIGNISWTVDVQNNLFTAAASGATSGPMWIFSSGQGHSTARGTVSRGQPIASTYGLSIDAGKWSDDVQISFSGGRAKEHLVDQAAPPNPNRVPLTEADRKGAVDPMTAFLIPVSGTGDAAVPKACERTIAVFDGRMRYDLRLAFKRLEKVKMPQGYQGTVVVCSVMFFPLAGHDPDRFLIKYLVAQHDMEIWLAPLAGSRLVVPYRASIPTPMGLGILQATQFVSARQTPRSMTTNLN